jgi:glycosyltransferase involved in cell wall biosynthesis
MTLALIINTFNQPEYLARVLKAVARQTWLPQEVLLADDGSEEETRRLFGKWASSQPFRCEHAWQAHEGFRRARVLNQAIARARGDYLVFLDGDTIPHPQFCEDHRRLAKERCFVQGHRALVEKKAAADFGWGDFKTDRRRALCRGQLRGLKNVYRWPRPWKRLRSDLHGVRGCNLAIWREDLLAVNGYNEAFVGWGREDSELALRLINSGILRLDVRGWALCYHLWHPPATRAGLDLNDQILQAALESSAKKCEQGVDQFLPARI